jgi:lysophospholipase L1-like esterase
MSHTTQTPGVGGKTPPRHRSLPLRKKILFACIPFLFLYAAGEVFLRWREQAGRFIPMRRADWFIEANPYMRRALVPGAHVQSGNMQIDVNSLGFRGDEIAVPKPPGTFRIFAIGESTTFGWERQSHRDAWPALLEAKLRAAYPDRAIEVVNAGYPSATSVEQRINFMLRISKLEPDAILIYHGNNDIGWSWVPDVETKLVYSHEASGPATWWDRLTDHSYVYTWVRAKLIFRGRANAPKYDEPDPAALTMLKGNLKELIDDARRRNVKAAIATYPHALDENGAPGVFSDDERRLNVPSLGRWFEHLSPQGARASFPLYNENVREIARTEGIPLCDLAPAIPPTPQFHIDWCHFNDAGEQRVAELWFDTLQKAGWFR